MKALFYISLLILISCSKVSNSSRDIDTTTNGVINKTDETTYTKEELEFGVKLSNCFNTWETYYKAFRTNDQLQLEDAKLLTIGIVGKECLQIEDLNVLKIIMNDYETVKNNNDKKWNSFAKIILQKESL